MHGEDEFGDPVHGATLQNEAKRFQNKP